MVKGFAFLTLSIEGELHKLLKLSSKKKMLCAGHEIHKGYFNLAKQKSRQKLVWNLSLGSQL